MAQKGSSTSKKGLPNGAGLESQKGAYPLARPNHHILVSEGPRATEAWPHSGRATGLPAEGST